MKIYTRTGDKGETSLYGGERVSKDSLRVEAYGTVDELNSHLGVSIAESHDASLISLLTTLQNHLFELGGVLATPPRQRHMPPNAITPEHVIFLEHQIDSAQKELAPLTKFILPGGSTDAGRLHLARTVCRRAERACVRLAHSEDVDALILTYLNRLSDLLFVLARLANHRAGIRENTWPSTESTNE